MDNTNNSSSFNKILFIVTAVSVSAYFAYQKFYKTKSNNEKKDYTSNVDQLGIKRYHL